MNKIYFMYFKDFLEIELELAFLVSVYMYMLQVYTVFSVQSRGTVYYMLRSEHLFDFAIN